MNQPSHDSGRRQQSQQESLQQELDDCIEALRQLDSDHSSDEPSSFDARCHELIRRLLQLGQQLSRAEHDSVPSSVGTEDQVQEVQQIVGQRRIEKYEIRQLLRVGGQAMAVLAFDPDLQRNVLLKIAHRLDSTRQQDELLREGRALARVQSPYVAKCYAAEQLGKQRAFLVIEYIAGQSLAERLEAGEIPLDHALSIIQRVCLGLAEVHACGLLHRDLKPANIMMDHDGNPKIIDFGLAASLGQGELRRARGTLAYMAPEQARADMERIDARTDLFAVGAVLYELLTGRPPYVADSTEELLQLAQRGQVVPPGQIKPGLPPALGRLCMRCLHPSPQNRFRSASELQQAIQLCRRTLQRQASSGRRRLTFFATAAGIIVALALFAWFSGQWLERSTRGGDRSSWVELVHRPAGDQARPRKDFFLRVEMNGGRALSDGSLEFVAGESLSFRIESDTDCYLGIFSIEEGQAIQLYPNRSDPDWRLEANRSRVVPSDREVVPGEDPLLFEAYFTGGEEYLHIFASSEPWQLDGQRQTKDEKFTVFDNPQVVQRWIDDRGFKGVRRDGKPTTRISEHLYRYRVVERSANTQPSTGTGNQAD